MRNLIIGTAGHIDHGKTALIKALNGFNGDSLEEEIQRGITKNLSFSNLENISFIDVPGHEDLVKTMISGAFGFDVCMLVVAANEGLKEQSLEHLYILNLLNIKNILVVINKIDLVDKEKIDLLKIQIQDKISSYRNLNLLNIFALSAKNLIGIDELKTYLLNLKVNEKNQNGIFRCYIDRVFSLKGIGNIITASVLEGSVELKDKLYLYDLDKEILIRGLEVHSQKKDKVVAGDRVALNVTNIDFNALKKGQFISKKGYFRGFLEIDCEFFGEIKHNSNLLVCYGSNQAYAKINIYNEKFANLKFSKPVFLKFNEALVFLQNSRVIGGALVLNSVSEPMKKKEKILLLKELSKKDFLSAFDRLKNNHKFGFGLISSYQRFGLNSKDAIAIAKKLKNAFVDDKNLNVYDISALDFIKKFIKFILDKNPHAVFSANSIALKLNWASDLLCQQVINELEKEKLISFNNGVYFKFGVDFKELKLKIENEILKILKLGDIAPLAPYNIYDELEIDRLSGDNALKKLCSKKLVKRLSHNLFVSSDSLNRVLDLLKDIIKSDGFVNVQNAKNHLKLSRKFIISYLEELDKDKEILKENNNRLFKQK